MRVQRIVLISDEVYRRRRKIKFNILRRTTINLSKMMIVLRRMDSSLTRMGIGFHIILVAKAGGLVVVRKEVSNG